jgi:hypothetical protein
MVQQIAAPQRRKRTFGISSVVPYILEGRFGGPAGDEFVWDSFGCDTTLEETRAGCYDDRVTDGLDDPKSPNGISPEGLSVGPFAFYKGVECYIGGDEGGPDYEEMARTYLEFMEDRGVEGKVAEWLSTPAASAATLVRAIGLAEEDADQNYIAQPVLWMNRADAEEAAAAGALEADGEVLRTMLGTPVVASHQFTAGEVAVSGWPVVLAGNVVANTAIKMSTNVEMAIAERVYALGIDCSYQYVVSVTAP